MLQGAPSVQMQEIPPDMSISDEEDDLDQDNNPDVRETQRFKDGYVTNPNEYYKDDRDNDRTPNQRLLNRISRSSRHSHQSEQDEDLDV